MNAISISTHTIEQIEKLVASAIAKAINAEKTQNQRFIENGSQVNGFSLNVEYSEGGFTAECCFEEDFNGDYIAVAGSDIGAMHIAIELFAENKVTMLDVARVFILNDLIQGF